MARWIDVDPPDAGPAIDELAPAFVVYEAHEEGDELVYLGEPRASRQEIMRQVWPVFRELGYEVRLDRRTGEYALVAEPVDLGIDGIPWTNVVLAVATIFSTLLAGVQWYYIRNPFATPLDTVATVWPFAAAVLGVLGIHELGHYVMSRRHNVQASLPYFIPMPTIIGTMGAVIKMKGQMPNRKALFDIGVAGPLAGLVATVVVTVIGLSLPPIEVPRYVLESPNAFSVSFGYPMLFRLIAVSVGELGLATGPPLYSDPIAVLLGREGIGYASRQLTANPVVFGGWVGMFVTFLNMLPVGQLDGGHIARSMFGKRHDTVAAVVPGVLFGLAGYLYYFREVGSAVGIWVFWGLIAIVLAYAGSANPVFSDELDTRRKVVGVIAFALGLLCFVPVPIAIVP